MRYGNTIIRGPGVVVSPFGFGMSENLISCRASPPISLYCRPVNEKGERVTPSALETHRVTHRFRGPCCFCAMSAPSSVTAPVLVEAAVFMDESNRKQIGEYIAVCAQGNCPYKGASPVVPHSAKSSLAWSDLRLSFSIFGTYIRQKWRTYSILSATRYDLTSHGVHNYPSAN
jgi:hypothetical protein